MSNPTYDMKAGELIAGAKTLWVPMVPQPVKDSEGMFGTLWRWMECVGVDDMLAIVIEDKSTYRVGQTLALCEGWRFGPIASIAVNRLSKATIQDGIDAGSDGEAHPRLWIQ